VHRPAELGPCRHRRGTRIDGPALRIRAEGHDARGSGRPGTSDRRPSVPLPAEAGDPVDLPLRPRADPARQPPGGPGRGGATAAHANVCWPVLPWGRLPAPRDQVGRRFRVVVRHDLGRQRDRVLRRSAGGP